MERKTRREILISLHNDQLATMVSREAQIKVFEKMPKERVVKIEPDLTELRPKPITAGEIVEKAKAALEVDQQWMTVLEAMIEEDEKAEAPNKRGGMEKG